jgi:hypothetical protein
LSSGQFGVKTSRHGNPRRNYGVLHVPSPASEVPRVGSVAIVACVAPASRSGPARSAGDAGARAGSLRCGHDLGRYGAAPPGGRRTAARGAGTQYRASLASLAGQPGDHRGDVVAAVAADPAAPLGGAGGSVGLRSHAASGGLDGAVARHRAPSPRAAIGLVPGVWCRSSCRGPRRWSPSWPPCSRRSRRRCRPAAA